MTATATRTLLLCLALGAVATAQEGIPLDLKRPARALEPAMSPPAQPPTADDPALKEIVTLGHYLSALEWVVVHQGARTGALKRLASWQLKLIDGFEPNSMNAPLTNAQLRKLFRLRDSAVKIHDLAEYREARRGLAQAVQDKSPQTTPDMAGPGEIEERLTRLSLLSGFFAEYREIFDVIPSESLRAALQDTITLQQRELKILSGLTPEANTATHQRLAALREEIAAAEQSLASD